MRPFPLFEKGPSRTADTVRLHFTPPEAGPSSSGLPAHSLAADRPRPGHPPGNICRPYGTCALLLIYPALTRWANLFRSFGAGYWRRCASPSGCGPVRFDFECSLFSGHESKVADRSVRSTQTNPPGTPAKRVGGSARPLLEKREKGRTHCYFGPPAKTREGWGSHCVVVSAEGWASPKHILNSTLLDIRIVSNVHLRFLSQTTDFSRSKCASPTCLSQRLVFWFHHP